MEGETGSNNESICCQGVAKERFYRYSENKILTFLEELRILWWSTAFTLLLISAATPVKNKLSYLHKCLLIDWNMYQFCWFNPKWISVSKPAKSSDVQKETLHFCRTLIYCLRSVMWCHRVVIFGFWVTYQDGGLQRKLQPARCTVLGTVSPRSWYLALTSFTIL